MLLHSSRRGALGGPAWRQAAGGRWAGQRGGKLSCVLLQLSPAAHRPAHAAHKHGVFIWDAAALAILRFEFELVRAPR